MKVSEDESTKCEVCGRWNGKHHWFCSTAKALAKQRKDKVMKHEEESEMGINSSDLDAAFEPQRSGAEIRMKATALNADGKIVEVGTTTGPNLYGKSETLEVPGTLLGNALKLLRANLWDATGECIGCGMINRVATRPDADHSCVATQSIEHLQRELGEGE